MTEVDLHRAFAIGVIVVGACVFASLFFVAAPYGRHERKGWGPTMPTRWAWVVMESPAVFAFLGIYALGQHRLEVVPLLFLALWQLHYAYRTLWFPFRLKASGKTTPVTVVLMAIVFNLVNAYVNARQISHLGSYPTAWLTDPRAVGGILLFLAGRQINVKADLMLIALREEGEGYRIPRGWLYRFISCPNYFGEILEWFGWALLTWSLAGLSFALFTVANLAPRAFTHHRWYRDEFEDYPPERRALIPFVL